MNKLTWKDPEFIAPPAIDADKVRIAALEDLVVADPQSYSAPSPQVHSSRGFTGLWTLTWIFGLALGIGLAMLMASGTLELSSGQIKQFLSQFKFREME